MAFTAACRLPPGPISVTAAPTGLAPTATTTTTIAMHRLT
jgi:hypothetical protein